MLKKIAFGAAGVLLVVVGAVALFVSMQPDEFKIERSRTMTAPPGVVFGFVSDLEKSKSWSPWENLDPAMKREITGPAGSGATYAWSGNDKAGEGKMTITECVAGEKVVMKVEFVRPMESVCTSAYTFTPEGTGTRVDWAMSGPNNFLGKLFFALLHCDDLIAADLEKGLAALDDVSAKAASEKVALSTGPAH